MHRREVLKLLGALGVIPFVPRPAEAALRFGGALHARLSTEPLLGFRTFDVGQAALMTQLAEAIIPETDTPGATAVGVPQFIDLLLTDWYSPPERQGFLDGLAAIDRETNATFGRSFGELEPDQRETILRALDGARRSPSGAGPAFEKVKELTVFGYFTSEPVQKGILKTVIFPGRYDGCVTLQPRGA